MMAVTDQRTAGDSIAAVMRDAAQLRTMSVVQKIVLARRVPQQNRANRRKRRR
jgi:hypothetical protein